jgi:hypothetical protein
MPPAKKPPAKKPPAKRARKPAEPTHGRNRAAIEATIGALQAGGLITDTNAARVAAAQALADAVDTDPTNASLWREYRAAVETLLAQTDAGTDEYAALLSALSAPVGNATKRNTADSRR